MDDELKMHRLRLFLWAKRIGLDITLKGTQNSADIFGIQPPPGFHDGPGFFETQIKNIKKEDDDVK